MKNRKRQGLAHSLATYISTQIGISSKFSDKDNFLLLILSSKLEINIMPSNWGNDTYSPLPPKCTAHHPKGIEWHFRKLAKPRQKSEVAKKRGERMREGGKQEKN